jgi:hypothetical protein
MMCTGMPCQRGKDACLSSPTRCRVKDEGLVLRVCRRQRHRHKVELAPEAYTIRHASEGVDNNARSLTAPSTLQRFKLRCGEPRPSAEVVHIRPRVAGYRQKDKDKDKDKDKERRLTSALSSFASRSLTSCSATHSLLTRSAASLYLTAEAAESSSHTRPKPSVPMRGSKPEAECRCWPGCFCDNMRAVARAAEG